MLCMVLHVRVCHGGARAQPAGEVPANRLSQLTASLCLVLGNCCFISPCSGAAQGWVLLREVQLNAMLHLIYGMQPVAMALST